jgi:hypothetical protein
VISLSSPRSSDEKAWVASFSNSEVAAAVHRSTGGSRVYMNGEVGRDVLRTASIVASVCDLALNRLCL